MMEVVLGGVACFFLGATFGVLVLSCLIVARDSDDELEREYNKTITKT